tara:strand:+ start:10433 stop:10609 length:177 start_codon:yes stop_codon:yes gene_type:complete
MYKKKPEKTHCIVCKEKFNKENRIQRLGYKLATCRHCANKKGREKQRKRAEELRKMRW